MPPKLNQICLLLVLFRSDLVQVGFSFWGFFGVDGADLCRCGGRSTSDAVLGLIYWINWSTGAEEVRISISWAQLVLILYVSMMKMGGGA